MAYQQDKSAGVNADRVTSWQKIQEVRPSKYTLWDHNFQLPGQDLEASGNVPASVTAGAVAHPLQSDVNRGLEIYDFPGGYAKHYDGVNEGGGQQAGELSNIFPSGKSTAKVRMEEEAVQGLRVQAESNCGQFTPGYQFQLSRHFDADGAYVLTRVQHRASQEGAYTSADVAASKPFVYDNHFECIPAALPFRQRP